MSILGVFIIGHFVSWLLLRYRRIRGAKFWQKLTAVARYLSYRGFYVNALQWNSAPVGLLLLGTVGAIFFFCRHLRTASPGIVIAHYLCRHGSDPTTLLLAE